jgi:hypothetical protein
MGAAMSELQIIDPKQQQAKLLAASDLVPDAYRGKPANVYLAILTGEALGIHPVTALASIQVIKGKPTMSAELMRGLVQQKGHRFRIDEASNREARVTVARKEWPEDTSTFSFTMEDAARAGLDKSDTYRKFPQAMLLARVTTQACRAVFADVLAGVSYDPTELEEPPRPAPVEIPAHVHGPLARAMVSDPMTPDQKKYLGSLVREAGYGSTADFLASQEAASILGGAPSDPLLKAHATALIKALKQWQEEIAEAIEEEATLIVMPTPEEIEGGSHE